MIKIKTQQRYFEWLGVSAQISCFVPSRNGEGLTEWHVMLHVEPREESFPEQLKRLYAAEDFLISLPEMAEAHYVFKRYFLSDSTNQAPLMREEPLVSLSHIQQPPLDGSKVGVWLYLQDRSTVTLEHGVVVVEHQGYRHLWQSCLVHPEGDSAAQTTAILNRYEDTLARFGANLATHCMRTWFFVRDVDTQYAGLVTARRENFRQQGLTEQTHYIASTGIGGSPSHTKALVQLDTYALMGFQASQRRFLQARSHLNPTYEYGVTFERGTLMEYGDRDHLYISGTASIDHRGQVLHEGQVILQTQRMWENVEALLQEGGASFEDVMQIVVYLRDISDFTVVSRLFHERFPSIPMIFTLAPVCRPTWLIEMECIAVRSNHHESYPAF